VKYRYDWAVLAIILEELWKIIAKLVEMRRKLANIWGKMCEIIAF
jgi:hypothetical protein